MKKVLHMSEMPDDVLSMIFDSCSLNDLLNLYHVCKRFQTILEQSTFLRRSFDLLLVGHRNPDAISKQRTIRPLSYHKRVTIFQNWCSGRYQEHILFPQSQFNPSRIFLEKHFLYKSHAGQLRKYARSKQHREVLYRRPVETYGEIRDGDITCFTKNDNTIFMGRRNGRVNIISVDANENDSLDATNVSSKGYSDQRVESVDFSGDIFVTSTLQRAALWQKRYELDMPYLDLNVELGEGFKCISLSPDVNSIAMGKYKDASRRGLQLFDLETNEVIQTASETTSIYDLHWKDNNVILTGNYDTTFRVYDRRTDCDELIWHDPFDMGIYSISYDGNSGVLCGVKCHSRVNLYDLRVPNNYIQLFFPTPRFRGSKGVSSPAYQVANDQTQLFIVTDYSLRVIDFDADWAESKDYTNMFFHEMIVNANS